MAVLHGPDIDNDAGQILNDIEHNYDEENSNGIEKIIT
jgi:hypothetical protein